MVYNKGSLEVAEVLEVAEADDEGEEGEPLDMSQYGNNEMELCDKFEDTQMM